MKPLKSCSLPILRDYFRSHPEAIGVRVKGQSKSIDGCSAPESVSPLSRRSRPEPWPQLFSPDILVRQAGIHDHFGSVAAQVEGPRDS
jgi:hypothetical protein